MSEKKLQIAIIEYLQRLSKQPGSLDADSIEVAVSCLSEALGIDISSSTIQEDFLSNQQLTLEEVFTSGIDTLTNGSSSSSNSTNASTSTLFNTKTFADITAEDKAQAEQYKNDANALLNTQPKEAYELYTKAIELNPFNHIYWNNRAVSSFKLGDYEKCRDDAKQSIKINTAYSKSHYRLALANIELKKWGDALDSLNKAKSVAKSNNETALVTEIDNLIRTTKQQQSGQSSQQQQSPMGGFDINSLLGGAGGAGGFDLNSIMQNPMFSNLMQGMMGNMGNMGQQQQQVNNNNDDDGDYDEDYDEDDDNQSTNNTTPNGMPDLSNIDMNSPHIQSLMQDVQRNPQQFLNNPQVMALMQQMMGGGQQQRR